MNIVGNNILVTRTKFAKWNFEIELLVTLKFIIENY